MNADITRLLTNTIADGRLARAERRSLRDCLDPLDLDPDTVQQLRATVFDVARTASEAGTTSVDRALDWAEDVLTLIASIQARQLRGPAVRAEAHFSPGEAPRDRVIALLRDARSQIDICVFTITDNGIARAIEEAHARGVTIRIITDNDKAYDRGSDVQSLSESGIAVAVDQTPAHMHHKLAHLVTAA